MSDDTEIDLLRKQLDITNQLLKSGGITSEEHAIVCQFLNSEIASLSFKAFTGLVNLDKSVQSEYGKEIGKLYGADISGYKGIFSNVISSPQYTSGNPWKNYKYNGPLDYAKKYTGRWSDDAAESDNPLVFNFENAIVVSYPDLTGQLTDDEAVEFLDQIKTAMEQELGSKGIFREYVGQYGSGAADVIWKEYGGIVLCECDDPNCDAQIDITHDEYLHASGNGGYYRVTSSGCSYGVLGAYLVERGKNYHVWTKMA